MVVLPAKGDNSVIINPKNATFQITDTKRYILVVTLSRETEKKLLEQSKSGFKRNFRWNKWISQLTIKSNNNNLNYLVDLTFAKVNRLLVLQFERNVEWDHRDCFFTLLSIKEFSFFIDGKSLFDLPIKNEEEAYENIIWDE